MSDDVELRIPRDEAAERAVLGACMETPHGYREAVAVLTETDFWTEAHRLLWRHIGACVEAHGLADPVLVLDALRTAGEFKAEHATLLHTLYASAAPIGSVSHHARIVADCATRRRVIEAGRRMVQRAESGEGAVSDLLAAAAADLSGARDATRGVELLTTSLDDFLTQHVAEPDWVVPGLLARGDRFVLTGSGGSGKSTLLRQIAVCAAAGVPPFDWATDDTYDPARVMLIDCENSDHQLKTLLWGLRKEAESNGTPVEDRLTVGGHGNPLDLLDQATAMSLLRTVEHDRPDLVYIGPVYKLHQDDPDKETTVKRITGVLDRIRETGCALITEAHHAKQGPNRRTLEPSGSNVWTWWPEFGRGLRLDPDTDVSMRRSSLEPWRIDRVQRNWPAWIHAGGSWPWVRSPENSFYGWAGRESA